jgi:Protein of unknown function (DUF2924)
VARAGKGMSLATAALPRGPDGVRAIQSMTLQEVRAVWAARYGQPPRLRSADLLRRMLAWRVQVEEVGGLDPELRAALKTGHVARRAKPPSGAKVAREWKGVRHEAEVVEAGVLYRGRMFRSLSSVAREITGVRWNGHRFFGLRTTG